jgi:TolB protein
MNMDGFVEAEDAVAERPLMDVPPTSSETVVPSSSPTISETPSYSPTPEPFNTVNGNYYGFIVFAARENGFSRLWYYIPGETEARRLTTGSWDDRHPALSPNGRNLAFASRRDGNWDLYTLDLLTGEIRRLTATMGYEGSPSWSPDGNWLAFEAYYDGNFDIWLLPVFTDGEPYQLTSNKSSDLSPEWGLEGREIVFTSNRTGNFDIYLADLDQAQDRFFNLTNTEDISESKPCFEPGSNQLAYVSTLSGRNRVVVRDMSDYTTAPVDVGSGILPTWSPDGTSIAVVQRFPYESQLINYTLTTSGGLPLNLLVDGDIEGMDWHIEMEGDLNIAQPPIGDEPQSLFDRIIETPASDGGRYSLIKLNEVSAPKPLLSDRVNEAFEALRRRIALDLGWDFLANLDYAFVGINDPLPPGYSYDDWLFTGRAFAISEAIARAGWVELIKEEVLGETYWRVYIRTRYQDGSLGEPLRDFPWDFSSRIAGDPTAYDQGGTFKESIPAGYYVDFTDVAADYGFLRQAALGNWRTYYPGSRYNEFALMDGMSWEEAMLELYPRTAILTPTPFRTPTPTPTRTPWPTSTPWWWRALTPTTTSTPTVTLTPTASQ